MSAYTHMLVALDLSREAEQVLQRASELAQSTRAQISLLHVVEPMVSDTAYDILPAVPVEFELNLVERAKNFLATMVERHQLQDVPCHVEVGSVKNEIMSKAEAIGADLVVLGTHGRHGVAMILGSTANALLHGTTRDILAVRIQPPTLV